MNEVQVFIKLKEMLFVFDEDPLTPFGIIVRNVHGHNSSTALAEWFAPRLKEFGKKHTPPFGFDGNSLMNGRKGKTHCVLSVALKRKGDTTMDSISKALELAFGMTVHEQGWSKKKQLEEDPL